MYPWTQVGEGGSTDQSTTCTPHTPASTVAHGYRSTQANVLEAFSITIYFPEGMMSPHLGKRCGYINMGEN